MKMANGNTVCSGVGFLSTVKINVCRTVKISHNNNPRHNSLQSFYWWCEGNQENCPRGKCGSLGAALASHCLVRKPLCKVTDRPPKYIIKPLSQNLLPALSAPINLQTPLWFKVQLFQSSVVEINLPV